MSLLSYVYIHFQDKNDLTCAQCTLKKTSLDTHLEPIKLLFKRLSNKINLKKDWTIGRQQGC
jgi:hypothetical protein